MSIKSATKFTFCDFTDAADAFRDVTFPSLRAEVGLDAGREPPTQPGREVREAGREPPPPPGWEVAEAGRDCTGVGGFSATDSALDVPGVVGYIDKRNIFSTLKPLK